MKLPQLRLAAWAFVLVASFARLAAQTPSIIIVFKANGYLQTSATTQETFQPGFGAEVDFPGAVSAATQVQLLGPGGATVTLARSSNLSYYLEQYYASAAALNQVVPDGIYNVVVSGGGVASLTPVTLQGGSSFRPSLITNFDALQNWSDSSLRVNWSAFDSGNSNDYVLFTIERANGTEIYSSPDPSSAGTLTGTSTTITVNGLTVAPGEVIYGHLMFVRLDISFANANRTGVASGSGYYVRFPITRAAAVKPAITTQPQAIAVALGSTAVVSVSATGSGLTYQWKKNGLPIAGATSATYVVGNAQSATVGTFSVDVSNPAGTVTSADAAITVVNTANFGRLTNLSILTSLASAGDFFTLGYVVGNSSAAAPLPLVIRAAGPGLGALGYPGTLADPKLELFAGLTKIGESDNWGGTAALKAGFTSVGAFPFASDASKDAAALANSTTRDNSARVSATDNGTGAVIAEIYDATPGGTFAASSPRLINVSVLKNIGSGLTAGFTIGGATARTVLIRAIGPTLGILGVPGGVPDPKLELFAGQSKINENDDWAGDSALVTAFTSVGAFSLPTTSKDAAIVVSLNPGSYTARVTGANNVTGSALVEIYEVP